MTSDPFAYLAPFIVSDNAFTPAELDAIEAYCDRLPSDGAAVQGAGDGAADAKLRITEIAWIKPNAATQWLYHRVEEVVHALNEQIYQFDLGGFSEPFQYTVYRGAAGSHYDWHVDQGALKAQRKLSLSLQLSDPAQYEGCELQIQSAGTVITCPRNRGALIAFPAHTIHRVTPIRSGTRKSVVIWGSGPKFR